MKAMMIPMNRLLFDVNAVEYDPAPIVESIIKHGFQEHGAILVKSVQLLGETYYYVITGRRRASAAALVGMTEIPAYEFAGVNQYDLTEMRLTISFKK